MYCYINCRGFYINAHELANNLKIDNFHNNCYRGKFKNLRIWIKSDGTYTLQGSIWVYYNGDNYGKFTLTEFKDAIYELNSLTFDTLLISDVVGFEFGVNIEINEYKSFLEAIGAMKVGHLTKLLLPNYSKSELWGKQTQETYLNYKIYIKTLDNKINNNVKVRYEIKVDNVKCGLKKRLQLLDLLNPNIYIPLIDKYKEAASGLIVKPIFEINQMQKLKSVERHKYLLLCNTDLSVLQSQLKCSIPNKKTYEAAMNSFKTILSNSISSNLKDEFVKKVTAEIDAAITII